MSGHHIGEPDNMEFVLQDRRVPIQESVSTRAAKAVLVQLQVDPSMERGETTEDKDGKGRSASDVTPSQKVAKVSASPSQAHGSSTTIEVSDE